MFHGKLYKREISARTLPALKRKASVVANASFNAFDEMEVIDDQQKLKTKLHRINRKYPDNTIIYGQWK